jgi:hypothetical protein
MSEGWNGNEKRTTKEPPKVRGGHRKPGGVVVKPKDEAAKKSR